VTEPEARSISDLIRDGGRVPDPEDDPLRPLRERVAAEEGIADWAEELHGGNETQIRQSALTLRSRLGLPHFSPTMEAAIAAQRRAQAERNARMNH
jgi:hypothetical protein